MAINSKAYSIISDVHERTTAHAGNLYTLLHNNCLTDSSNRTMLLAIRDGLRESALRINRALKAGVHHD